MFDVAIVEMGRVGFDVVVEDRTLGVLRARMVRTGEPRGYWDVTATIATSRTAQPGPLTSIAFVVDTNDMRGVVPEQDALVRAIMSALDRSFQRLP